VSQLSPLPLLSSNWDVELLAVEKGSHIPLVRTSCVAMLQRGSGWLFRHYLLTRFLNGSGIIRPPILRSNPTLFGQYPYWGSKVRTTNSSYRITDKPLASRSPSVRVRQHKDENPNIALMCIGLIAGTPFLPQIAFSVDLLDMFFHLRRRQPSIGVQGFVKAMCASQQV
jgi:hypothetical protein